MCGIVGQIGFPVDDEALQRALDAVAHRGPDMQGTWRAATGDACLGHRRLSIVDLSEAGRQPMSNESGSLWMVCNGEIYNAPTLRERLEGLGHRFASRSDSEVLVHGYEEWGSQLLDRLIGMYAFALWDEQAKQLLLARDHVGIKPLYYQVHGQGIVFASELGALLALSTKRPELEPEALAYVMTLGYVPAPASIWSGVRKLQPGEMLTFSPAGGVRTRRYWLPPDRIHEETASQSQWEELFHDILRDHLLSDVPVATFLSGGLDSSAVAAGLAARHAEVEALTLGFSGSPKDESVVARQTARHLGMQQRTLALDIDDLDRLIDRVVAASDEPQGYSALLTMYAISELAAKHYRVVMSGDGGDELFGGYRWYRRLLALPHFAGSASQLLSRTLGRLPSRRLDAFAETSFRLASPLHRHARRLFPRFLPGEACRLLAPLDLAFDDSAMLDPLRRHFRTELPIKKALQRVDLMTFCSDSILAKVDRMSMAHALEVRVPLLDKRAIEWTFSRRLPDDRRGEQKTVLRRYLAPRVPPAVLRQPKRGFSLPILDHFDWESALETIRCGHWVQNGYFGTGWEAMLAVESPHQHARIWILFMLTKWAERWMGAAA